MKVIAIIPARGGSKGIPKKNIRLMNGKPLISYVIKTVLNSKYDIEVYVSTDSKEIADISELYGAKIINRKDELAGDFVTLDPVIFDGVEQTELKNNCRYDYVITMQPTSPLTTIKTLDDAIEKIVSENLDTLISAVNKPYLSWGENGGTIQPLYKERKNRQLLPQNFLETGAFLITKREFITKTSRIGKNVSVYEVPEKESIDIDDSIDWVMAESLMKRKRIVFRCDAYVKLGMGHIYNCITLAYSMIEHEILFVIKTDCTLGIKKLEEAKLNYKTISKDEGVFNIIKEFKPDIFVNDLLNTEADYILKLKEKVSRVVTIEDLGSGAYKADAVINAVYDSPEDATTRFYSGYKYVCLRDEFQIAEPKAFSNQVNSIIVMFGGTDPSNLNKRVYNAAIELTDRYPDISFHFITGIGYDAASHGVVNNEIKRVYIHQDVKLVTKFMTDADIAFTSQGRTIYELASMGIPSIVLSQNQRETTHSFANMTHGFINLGLGVEVDESVIKNTLSWLIETPQVRRNMRDLMLKCSLKTGLERVKRIIVEGE